MDSYRQANKIKRSFFQAVVVSILLHGCTIWMLTKCMEKRLDSNYIRMLWAILNKSWRQHPTKQQLYGHLPPIMKTIEVKRTRYVGHCWRSGDELILLWTPSHKRAKAGWPARTYIQQLCANTECSLEDLLGVMEDKSWVTRECQGDLCWQRDMMMMMKQFSSVWPTDKTLSGATIFTQPLRSRRIWHKVNFFLSRV